MPQLQLVHPRESHDDDPIAARSQQADETKATKTRRFGRRPGVAGGANRQAYLDEYCYRLNRRGQRDIFRRLLNRCLLYTGPATYALLTGT